MKIKEVEKIVPEKIVPEKRIKTTVFVADDGREFSTPKECKEYEAEILYANRWEVRTTDSLYPKFREFYKAQDADALKYILSKEGCHLKEADKLTVGEWFTIYYEYNPNGADDIWAVTLKEILSDLNGLD